jgi:hypothetical protein
VLPNQTVQDAPRVGVDLVHGPAAVRHGPDAEDALRALVFHKTQVIVRRDRIEELVAALGDVTVLDQGSEGLVEEDINLLGLEDVMRWVSGLVANPGVAVKLTAIPCARRRTASWLTSQPSLRR